MSLGRVAYETFPLTAENDFLPDLEAIPEGTAAVLSLSISITLIILRGL